MFHIFFINEIFKNSKAQKIFIKSYIIKFSINDNKNRTSVTYYFINNDYAMLKSLWSLDSILRRTGTKNKKLRKTKKLVSQKNQ